MIQKTFSFIRSIPPLFFILVDYVQFGFVYPVIASIFIHATPFDYPALFPNLTSPFSLYLFMAFSYLLTPLLMLFGSFILSSLSDFKGRRQMLILASLGMFVGVVVINNGVFIQSLPLFFLGRAMVGLSSASQSLACTVISDLTSTADRIKKFSLITFTNGIAFMLGPYIFNTLTAKDLGFHFGFIPLHILMCLLAFIFCALFFTETFPHKSHSPHLRPFFAFTIAKNKVLLLLVGTIFVQIAFANYFQMILIYLRTTFHYSQRNLGNFYIYLGAILMVASIFYYFLIRRWKSEKVLAVSFVIQGLCMLTALFHEKEWIVWTTAFPLVAANAFGYTSLLACYSKIAPDTHQGRVFALFGTTVAFSFVCAGIMALLLTLMPPQGIIFLGGIFALIGCLFFLFYNRALEERS